MYLEEALENDEKQSVQFWKQRKVSWRGKERERDDNHQQPLSFVPQTCGRQPEPGLIHPAHGLAYHINAHANNYGLNHSHPELDFLASIGEHSYPRAKNAIHPRSLSLFQTHTNGLPIEMGNGVKMKAQELAR